MKTFIFLFSALILCLQVPAQEPGKDGSAGDRDLFDCMKASLVAGPGAVYSGRIITLSDSGILLRTTLPSNQNLDLFFLFDRMDTIRISSIQYPDLQQVFPVGRDSLQYIRARNEMIQFAAMLIRTWDRTGYGSQLVTEAALHKARAEKYMKSAAAWGSVCSAIELPGLVLYGTGYFIECGPVFAQGLFLTVAGTDMGKFHLIPILKARKQLTISLNTNPGSIHDQQAIKQLNTAIGLAAASVVTNVVGEVLLVVGAFQNPESRKGKRLVISGLVMSGVGVFTSLLSTLQVSSARKTTGPGSGQVSMSAGKDGMGVIYHIPF